MTFFLHFFSKKFAYIKKKYYLCTNFKIVQITTFKKHTIMKTIYQLEFKTSDNVVHDLIFGNMKRCEKALKNFYSVDSKWRNGTYITKAMIIPRTLF